MYKIFVGDKPIVLTTTSDNQPHIKSYPLKKRNICKAIKVLNTTAIEAVHLVHKNEKKLLDKFLKKIPNVIAAGGKVVNQDQKILFIYRNDKWDLPKGKTERNEKIEATAIREVIEETGVKDLELGKPLQTTYHIFKRNSDYKLKITYWFEMKTDYSGALLAETVEGITKVAWLNTLEIKDALENSYANIKLLF